MVDQEVQEELEEDGILDSNCDVSGGAGNPGGDGFISSGNNLAGNAVSDNRKGENGTGGLMIVYADSLMNNGKIESNGSKSGTVNYTDHSTTGGSSGGGSINLFYKTSASLNRNQIVANGGESVAGNYLACSGGAGGNGSISIGNVSSGSYEE